MLQNGGGGGGGRGDLAMLKGGGGYKRFGVVLTHVLAVLAILEGGRKKFPSFKRRDAKGFILS